MVVKLKPFFKPTPILLIFILFLIIQLFLYFKLGVLIDREAGKYIKEGNYLYEAGKFSAPKYIFHLPIILLVYFCRLLDTSYYLVFIIQILLSGLSLLYFYRLCNIIGNKFVAIGSSILLVLFLPLQAWNLALYSDSIFISLVIIYVYIIVRNDKWSVKNSAIILLFLGLIIFSRPNGLLFIPPTIIYFIFRKQSESMLAKSIIISVGLIIIMYFFLNAVFTGGGDIDAMKPFIEEHIICYVPLKSTGINLDIVRTLNPVYDLFYYILHNPFHFLKLMGLKLLSFFNLTRSYYSTGHNIFLAIMITPIYLFSIPGMFYLVKFFRNFSLFVVPLIVLYPLGITFQCDDWHSRFAMAIFPFLIMLSCLGFYHSFRNRMNVVKFYAFLSEKFSAK